MNRSPDVTTNTPRLGIWSQSQNSKETSLTLGDAALEAARRLKGLSVDPLDDEQGVRTRDRLTERQVSSPADPPMTEEAYTQQVQELQDRLGEVMAEIAELERGLENRQADRSELTATPSENAAAIARETKSSLDVSASRREALLQETARLLAATRETLRRDRLAAPQAQDAPAAETDAQPRLQLYPSDDAAAESVTTSKAQNTSIDALFLPVAKGTAEPDRASDTPAISKGQASLSQLDRPMGPIAVQWEAPEPAKPSEPQVVTHRAGQTDRRIAKEPGARPRVPRGPEPARQGEVRKPSPGGPTVSRSGPIPSRGRFLRPGRGLQAQRPTGSSGQESRTLRHRRIRQQRVLPRKGRRT